MATIVLNFLDVNFIIIKLTCLVCKSSTRERQQQLDELTKELSRLQEETDILKLKLKQKGSKEVRTLHYQVAKISNITEARYNRVQ